MDDILTLVQKTYTQNEIGAQVETEVKTDVFARMKSVSRSEFFSAGQNGLSPSLVAITRYENYADQTEAVWKGKRYTIYRTYFNGNDDIELYLEVQAYER